MTKLPETWDGATVRRWLESRIVAARADQVAAERYGRERQDDCDMAAAEEMICAALTGGNAADGRATFVDALKRLADRDGYVWRGVYDDDRFERHARSYVRKLTRMARSDDGFRNTLRYQRP